MAEFVRAVYDAAAIHGELKRTLLAAGVVGILCCIAWAIQEWGVRKSVSAIGWIGLLCLGVASVGALGLISVGLM